MQQTVEITATRHCHCLAARRRARELTRFYDRALRPHGLRATQFSVLAVLAQTGPIPISELADFLSLERTTLTRNANLLERNGWIETASSDDARQRPLRLTPAGRRKLEEALPAWAEAQDLVDRGADAAPRTTPEEET